MAEGLPDFLPGHRAKVITKHIDVPDDGMGFPGHFAPPVGEPATLRQAQNFPVIGLDALQLGDDPTYLVEGLLPATGFGIVFGPPKSLKSFILSSCLFHVALGRPWAGCEVLQGAVVYITGEGIEGFKRRLIAMREHYGVQGQGVPFLMVPVAPDLGHASGDAEVLIDAIREALAGIGNPPIRAVAVDTLARTMKGADENSAKDMSVWVDNCEAIGRALGCIVVGVHHSGKDASRGARGSNALDGGVDVMWSVEKGDGFSTATVHEMKDGPAGATWQFRLLPVTLRKGCARFQEVASAVVEITSPAGSAQERASERKGKSLADRPRLLLDILRHAIGEMGQQVMGDLNVPYDKQSVSRTNLKRYLPLRGYWDGEMGDNKERAFLSQDIKTLVARGYAGATKDWIWLK